MPYPKKAIPEPVLEASPLAGTNVTIWTRRGAVVAHIGFDGQEKQRQMIQAELAVTWTLLPGERFRVVSGLARFSYEMGEGHTMRKRVENEPHD